MLNRTESQPALVFGGAGGHSANAIGQRAPGGVVSSVEKPTPTWKRAFDVAFAAAVLAFISPLLLVIGVLLLVVDGRPIFYRQSRIGQGGQSFSCLKFRTMVKDADARLDSLLATSPDAR